MKNSFRLILSRAGLVLLGVMISLTLGELIFRMKYPDPSPKLINSGLQLDETYGFVFVPKAEGWNTSLRGEYRTYIKINNKGLRGREHAYAKDDGTFRVLVLGDSFTAALQVSEEQTFVRRLETRLSKHYSPTAFEVINAGIIGFGTANELTYFTREGSKYQPDLVLLAFFTGNDVINNEMPQQYEMKNGELIPIAAPYRDYLRAAEENGERSRLKRLRNFIYTHSRIYSVMIETLTHSAIRQAPALARWLVTLGLVESIRPAINITNIYSFHPSPEEAWRLTEALLLKLKQEVEARQGRLLIAILPDESEVDEKKWQSIIALHEDLREKQGLIASPPADRLEKFLRRHGLSYVPLLPALKQYQEKTRASAFYPYDGHWTPAGHEVVSQAIFDYLIRHQDQWRRRP